MTESAAPAAERKSPAATLLGLIRALRDRRLWRIYLLGIASGFPWLLIGSAMTAWLADEGLTRTAIGFFFSIYVVYTVNFLWAPVVDHVRLPVLGRLGQRRSWIVLCQCLLILFTLLLAMTGPGVSVLATALIALGIAVVSATQDLAIDAYRINVIGEDEPELIGHGAAMATCGWFTGASAPGAVAFVLSEPLGWPTVYVGLAAVLVPISLLVWRLFQEPPPPPPAKVDNRLLIERLSGVASPHDQRRRTLGNPLAWTHVNAMAVLRGLLARALAHPVAGWAGKTYVDAVGEFFRRNGVRLALGLLAFIFLFKIGEAFLGRMVVVFYKEVGFTDADIGIHAKAVGLPVTIICALAAGLFAGRFGAVRGLFFAGIAMAATNLLFSWIAMAGPDVRLLSLAVVADGITSAFSTVAFVAFISYYTSRLHAAAQYGALASLGNSGRTLVAGASGLVVDDVLGGNWAMFFVLTALMVTPALAILAWISRGVREKA